MTLGWGPHTIAGVWWDNRSRRWILNLIGFGWHYQFTVRVTLDRWRR